MTTTRRSSESKNGDNEVDEKIVIDRKRKVREPTKVIEGEDKKKAKQSKKATSASSDEKGSAVKQELSPQVEAKLNKIMQVLDRYYPNPPVPLNHHNDFTFLVAVILSAQTTDGKVNDVTKELFELADTPALMSKLSNETVQKIIQPVGLAPKKAKYIVETAKILDEKFDGKVPGSFEELESLPGVGHKTASVIMSQLFGVSAFPVDTHVHRLALRWGLSKEQKNATKVQEDLCKLFPQSAWDKLHLQMIYFGREYCGAINHSNSDCPICSWIHKPVTYTTTISVTSTQQDVTFSPRKRAKGLVYYEDRIKELELSPQLTKYSPFKAERRITTIDSSELPSKVEIAEASIKLELV